MSPCLLVVDGLGQWEGPGLAAAQTGLGGGVAVDIAVTSGMQASDSLQQLEHGVLTSSIVDVLSFGPLGHS